MSFSKLRHELKYCAIKYFYTEKGWSINWMCKQLEIARSAYYKWLHRVVPEQELENIKVAGLIKGYDDCFDHILGYRRMTAWMNYFNNTTYRKNQIHRLMKKLNIHSVIRRKRKRRESVDTEETVENVLKRDFSAERPNEKWATDVTEFKVLESNKKLYLSAIIDLYDRSVVSYILSNKNDNQLVFKTFDVAATENPDAKPLFHSDRGYQYTSKTFQMKLQNSEMEQSMSRGGCCIDNGPVEGFWGIIKTEMYCMHKIDDAQTLREAIAKYIKFYNNERPQERYGCKAPMEVRTEALLTSEPKQYPIAVNKRIQKYKEKWVS